MPILAHANHVHAVAVMEDNEDHVSMGLTELAEQLGWSGIEIDYSVLARTDREPTALTLLRAARDRRAGLMVMGGYGHSHTRQFVFGGCTRRVLEDVEIDVPVFLTH